jgi:SAM dependent carboxyl methyltransferase
MEGNGTYNRNSCVQAIGSSTAVPLFEKAAWQVQLTSAVDPVVIADYGSSEGRNSLEPLTAAIGILRRRIGLERAIWVVHTDLPGNDFTALFRMLASDPSSYFRRDPAVFSSAIGRSFYDQILPSSSVSLGWSAWAVQWLSRVPVPIPDHVQVAYSQDAGARAAFAQQAAEDWRCFLTHRGAELRPDGRLVVLSMAVDEHGDFGYRPAVAAIYGGIMDLVEEGFVKEEEARRMVIPTLGRSRQEFMAPFGLNGIFSGLALEEIEVFSGEDHIWAEFQKNADSLAFGAGWAAFSRASVGPTLSTSLDPGEGRAAEFMRRLEARMTARLSSAPEQTLIPLAKMVLVKRSPSAIFKRSPSLTR